MSVAPTAAAQQGPPVTMYTQAALQALHDAIAHEPDPQDKQALSQALQLVLRVQAKNMQQGQGGGPGQAQGPQGPPAGPRPGMRAGAAQRSRRCSAADSGSSMEAPVGSGGRFKALETKLEKRKVSESRGGLAAYIGRKKYGKKRFQRWPLAAVPARCTRG